MNNQEVQQSIDDCKNELDQINHIIKGLGHMSNIVPFLTNYAIIKACGTIEYCFKTIVSDIHSGQSPQIVNYIDKMIRNGSMNPSLSNITRTLERFDEEWKKEFKSKVSELENNQKVLGSLASLNTARNTFAHGKQPSSSFENACEYFEDSVKIIEIIDDVVK